MPLSVKMFFMLFLMFEESVTSSVVPAVMRLVISC